jgi:hypothetical protein
MRGVIAIAIAVVTWVALGIAFALLVPLVGMSLQIELPYKLIGQGFSVIALVIAILVGVLYYQAGPSR